MPKPNIKFGTCMVCAYVFGDPDTFSQGHNQLYTPVMYQTPKKN